MRLLQRSSVTISNLNMISAMYWLVLGFAVRKDIYIHTYVLVHTYKSKKHAEICYAFAYVRAALSQLTLTALINMQIGALKWPHTSGVGVMMSP